MNKKRTKKDNKEAALSQDMSKDKSSKDNPRPNHVRDSGDNVENKSMYQEEYTYLPDNMHNELEESDSIGTIESLPDEIYFPAENLYEMLMGELNQQILGVTPTDENLSTLKNKISFLEKFKIYLTGRELRALEFCISSYASVCWSSERKKEIRRTLFLIKDMLRSNGIETNEFSKKIDSVSNEDLFEITEILIHSKIIRWCVWDLENISETFNNNESLEKLNEKSISLKNTGEDSVPITEPQNNKEETGFDINMKILELIKKVTEFRNRIDDYDKNRSYYHFSNSFGFHRRRTFLKFKSAKVMMDFKLQCRDKGVMNDSDSASDLLAVNELLGDFIRSESSKVKNRNVGYYVDNIRYDEKIHNFASRHDYSLICSRNDLENYESVIFEKENWELITFYYLEYIWFFPITIKEFERLLFLFLLYVTQKSYSPGLDVNDLFLLKDELNAVLSSKYIDFTDYFTLISLYIFSADHELILVGDEIFEDASMKIEVVKQQVNGVGS